MTEEDVHEIYTTLPERPATTIDMRFKILEFLKTTPNEWHKVHQIAKAIGHNETDKTMPTIRLACRELLHINREPIISCHAGFTYTTQRSMMRKFQENIQNRINGMLRTVNDASIVINSPKNWEN